MKQSNTSIALKWSTLGSLLPQAVNFFINIYIARLLVPKDYGLIAIATIIVSFLQDLLAGGLTTALIQKKGTTEEIAESADFIFTLTLITNTLFFILIVLFAPNIAEFFRSPEASLVITVMGTSLLICTFGSVQLALLRKNMDFKSIFHRQLMPIISQLFITVPMAYFGFGVWALVIGKLASDVLATIILWLKSEWKPGLNFNLTKNKDIIKFGYYVMLTAITGWIITQVDTLLVGKFLSLKDVGLYKMGFNLVNQVYLLAILPILPVYYAKSCSLKTDDDKVDYYINIKEYLSFIIAPILFGLILISPFVERLILGEKWAGIYLIVMFLSATGIVHLWALLSGLLKSMGKPNVDARIMLVLAFIYTAVWLVCIQYGLKIFLISRIITVFIAAGVYTYFENKVLKINIFKAVKFYYKAFLASSIMFIGGFCFLKFVLHDIYSIYSFISLILISAIIYLLVVCLISREKVNIIKNVFQYMFVQR
jgi:O-antigen/teichoic acid export membrane protein